MKKTIIGIAIVAVLAFWAMGNYNKMVTEEENVETIKEEKEPIEENEPKKEPDEEEKKLIEDLGGDCWFVTRTTLENVSNHESETSITWKDCFNKVIINLIDYNIILIRIYYMYYYII